MKKIGITLVIMFCLFATAYALSGISEESVKRKIEKANHCTTTSDCAVEGFGCPFDCWSYVNKSEIKSIEADIEGLSLDRCVYKCGLQAFNDRFPICEGGKCVSTHDTAKIFESYSCEETKAALEQEITYRNYCESDSECATAGDMGIGCPFSCDVVVSKRFFDGAGYKKLYEAYTKQCGQCEYKCAEPAKVRCINLTCISKN